MFLRRLGENGRQLCAGGQHCAQILEMNDGDYAVVGKLITEEAVKALPPGPGVGADEGVVKVPRAVFVAARTELPAA
jgi:hypothetical protein